jgi:SAM-dependent methyltransferase
MLHLMRWAVVRIPSSLRSRLGLRPRLVRRSILGREVLVLDGSVREKADYDDAWCLACAAHSRIVFDVGSNVGQAALPMLLTGVPELVVLIDANPQALAYAAENIFRNGLWRHSQFVCAFVGATGGDASLLDCGHRCGRELLSATCCYGG